MSGTQVSNIHGVLHNALNYAVRIGYIARKPTEAVDKPREDTEERPVAYELVSTWLATDGRTGLPAVRLGRTIRIPRAAIDRLAAVGSGGDGHGTGGAA